jgi:hypothetical protein
MVTWPDMIGWSPPAWIPTSAYYQSHRILTVLLFLWCSMDPINVSPIKMLAYIPAPAGSVMGTLMHQI